MSSWYWIKAVAQPTPITPPNRLEKRKSEEDGAVPVSKRYAKGSTRPPGWRKSGNYLRLWETWSIRFMTQQYTTFILWFTQLGYYQSFHDMEWGNAGSKGGEKCQATSKVRTRNQYCIHAAKYLARIAQRRQVKHFPNILGSTNSNGLLRRFFNVSSILRSLNGWFWTILFPRQLHVEMELPCASSPTIWTWRH